ncbi:MAG: acyl-CoA dehydrogenase C-terminal domain-containing protein [Gammaproteobacteria bacterium]|nr:acyl-CoA dehydrogenase C-terminal domain-containing protein [Gammaproteobacteria bacterium]MBU1491006.1 acyl-CoA dehydrogenase C-terminal domain-containing protein [Gammaproteobacteria bacterium]MBU2067846.1 acyl-CoA dehydrogenase C-terminal domain-containing protein [Gammaproteobacteria bacterium]MBU2139374.1 acyl-CoA dehydrogenase C-terminal domain-containing protein [Gammaproteobacteria bacterium]MBU2217246.1 acyl-CoA dehydrogenase C-terminal domain-containing protein [Gammaproteobacteria
MSHYRAPLRDMRFVFDEVLNAYATLQSLPSQREFGNDLGGAILEEAAKLAENVLAPLNGPGDKQGCRYDPQTHSVKAPDGFREAYKQFAEGGWTALACSTEFGGQGLPHVLNMMVEEMVCSANLSLGMYPGLTHGAINALTAHGTPELQTRYLPKLISGEWTGTMCLTEPQCGTDLGLIRTRAVPQADGSYAISGTKIWITGGEHDLVDNILHLVLAKLPDAPDSVKGISLFLVPKVLEDGSRNPALCGGLEHKMGIKGSATCVMNFEGAQGWLVGEVNKGLRCMFTMMNSARLMVGMQGLGLAETAYQISLGFARERLQSRSLSGPKAPDKPADPITVHPDVRRNLLRQKVMIEGGRALAYFTGLHEDVAHDHEDPQERERADDLVQLLTPVVKAFLTDEGFNCANDGLQVLGGSGYTEDWGIEQLVRDARITRIYEGTNGIQALDLVGRKLALGGGRAVRNYFALIEGWLKANPDSAHGEKLGAALKQLQQATLWVASEGMKDPEQAGAAATPYLRLFALTSLAWMWARMAAVAQARLSEGSSETAFYGAKLKSADFFMARVLTETDSLLAEVKAGKATLMAFSDEEFA